MEDTNAEVRTELEVREQALTVAIDQLREVEVQTKDAMAKLEEMLRMLREMFPNIKEAEEARQVFKQ